MNRFSKKYLKKKRKKNDDYKLKLKKTPRLMKKFKFSLTVDILNLYLNSNNLTIL